MEYVVSYITFFLVYFGLNYIINRFRKKTRLPVKSVFINSLIVSIIFILVIIISSRIS